MQYTTSILGSVHLRSEKNANCIQRDSVKLGFAQMLPPSCGQPCHHVVVCVVFRMLAP